MTSTSDDAVLLVDDDRALLRSAGLALQAFGIRRVLATDDPCQAVAIVDANPVSAVVIDLSMPKLPGRVLLDLLTEAHPDVPVLVMSGAAQLAIAVDCMRAGAYDYLVKPVDVQRLGTAIQRAQDLCRLQRDAAAVRDILLRNPRVPPTALSEIQTQNPAMVSRLVFLRQVASSPYPVLVTGESGTGKDRVAAALHAASGRTGQFVTVAVAALDEAEFSAALFGRTGEGGVAREGLVAAAAEGTLYLDGIDELSSGAQLKLVRLLQGSYVPIGADLPRPCRARILASSTHDLAAAAERGVFRRDLYHRLRAHDVHLPPLRERLGDLPLLVTAFVQREAERLQVPVPRIEPALYQQLRAYRFPGNIAELEAMCRDAMVRHEGGTLALRAFREHIAAARATHASVAPAGDEDDPAWLCGELPMLEDVERQLVLAALRRAGGNQTVAAPLIGLERMAFSRRLRSHGITVPGTED